MIILEEAKNVIEKSDEAVYDIVGCNDNEQGSGGVGCMSGLTH